MAAPIPDFTFFLPKGQVLYLDVKFPLAAYLRYLEAGTEAEREAHKAAFLRDVRQRVKELAARGYGQSARAVEEVLLFLPNETLSSFIHEHDPALLDEALALKVVLCSPLNLFVLLGVVRQAHDNFAVERTADDMLATLGAFHQQWEKFTDALDAVEKRLETARRGFEELNGPRRRQLEKPLNRLEDLRRERGLPADSRARACGRRGRAARAGLRGSEGRDVAGRAGHSARWGPHDSLPWVKVSVVNQPALDLGYQDDPADPTFSVRELARAVNDVLQRGFRDGVLGARGDPGPPRAGERPHLVQPHRGRRRGPGDGVRGVVRGRSGAHAAAAAAPSHPARERHHRADPRPARLLRAGRSHHPGHGPARCPVHARSARRAA